MHLQLSDLIPKCLSSRKAENKLVDDIFSVPTAKGFDYENSLL